MKLRTIILVHNLLFYIHDKVKNREKGQLCTIHNSHPHTPWKAPSHDAIPFVSIRVSSNVFITQFTLLGPHSVPKKLT